MLIILRSQMSAVPPGAMPSLQAEEKRKAKAVFYTPLPDCLKSGQEKPLSLDAILTSLTPISAPSFCQKTQVQVAILLSIMQGVLWSICLFLYQCQNIVVTVAFYSLKLAVNSSGLKVFIGCTYIIQIMAIYDLRPWLSTPETITSCPPGLEYLHQINQLTVCQHLDPLGVLRKFETSKTYEILNNQGQRIYFAEERNNCFLRHFCGFSRPFTMTIYDNVGRDVLALHKALKCSCCWSRCCLQKLLTLDEEMVIGKISKQYSGFVRGILTNGEKFGIQFPFDLDVKIKALMLGATFLIDYMYFELWP
nr:phospholipid scramblase 1-like [Symphalangus syndactylus]